MSELSNYIDEGIEARRSINLEKVTSFARILYDSLMKGGKLIVFGNGGSAADAQHFAAELTGHFYIDRDALPAIALSTNSSAVTAIANDYSFDSIFERQVDAFCKAEDVVVGISTSGNSQNIINGIAKARSLGARTFALTGRSGGRLAETADDAFRAQSDSTPIIQEVHITFIHMVCLILDKFLQSDSPL